MSGFVQTGYEKDDGTFSCSLCGTVHEGETVKEAISRLVIAHYGKMPKNTYWVEKYTRLGQHDNPTGYLPALWVYHKSRGRIFRVATMWDKEKREWVIAW